MILLEIVTDKLYHLLLYTSPRSRFELTTSVVIGTDCIGSCKSNYHAIKELRATSPLEVEGCGTSCQWRMIRHILWGFFVLLFFYFHGLVFFFCQNIHVCCLMVFNATFNNISVISWRSLLLMEKTGVPEENHRLVTSHWQILSHNVVVVQNLYLFLHPAKL
jgi:hypothetical protein